MKSYIIAITLFVVNAIPPFEAGAQTPLPDRDRAAVEGQIRKSIADWIAATNRGDTASANGIWAPSIQGWFHSAPEFKSSAAFESAVDAKTLRSTYAVTINEILVSSDLAVVRDTWEETVHASDGRSARRLIQSFEVWQPQPGGEWRISRWISAPGPWQHWKA